MEINSFGTLALGIGTYYLGVGVCAHSNWLQKLNIPVPVVGGLLCSSLLAALKCFGVVEFNFDNFFFEFFMSMFFCSAGFFINLKGQSIASNVLKLSLCVALCIVMQNFISLGVAILFGQPLAYSVCIGSVPMMGSFGSVGVFASLAEEVGVQNGVLSGMIMAVLGLISGGILGAPLGDFLLRKYHISCANEMPNATTTEENQSIEISPLKVLSALAILLVCMYVGYIAKIWVQAWNLKIPLYAGGMILAIILNNIRVFSPLEGLKQEIKVCNNVALNIFISISLLVLDLTIVGKIAAPVLVCIVAQVICMLTFCCVLMRFWQKNYLNVLFIAGLVGMGLGSLPTGIANVNSLIKKYGYNHNIYLLLPLMSSISDCINMVFIIFMLNVLK